MRVEHLQSATQRLVNDLLGITALGKFFAEKVEAGKPKDFGVAAQPLVPSAEIGGKEPQHQRKDQGRKKQGKPRATQIIPHRSNPRRGGVANPRLQVLSLTSCLPSTGANSRDIGGIFVVPNWPNGSPTKSAWLLLHVRTIRYPIPCVNRRLGYESTG